MQCNLLSLVFNSDASVQCDFIPVPLVTSTPRKGFMVQSESDISEPDEEAVNSTKVDLAFNNNYYYNKFNIVHITNYV